MALKLLFLLSLCGCWVGLTMPVFASPTPVQLVDGATYSISNVDDKCTGRGMAGMSVTFDYLDHGIESSQTLSWTKIQGTHAGRIVVYNLNNPKQKLLSLVERGDTSVGNWTLVTLNKNVTLKEITIDGFPGNTVFDTTFGKKEGTPGSGKGKDARVISLLPRGSTVSFTYKDLVALQPTTPVGDLYRTLDIKFSGTKAVPSLVFRVDTAAASPVASPVPVPATLLLIGSGLSFLWGVKKCSSRISSKV